jgi:hypothetical protein
MLNDVHRSHLSKCAVGEREGELIKVSDDIGSGGRISVHPYGARVLVNAAANVQHRQLARCC